MLKVYRVGTYFKIDGEEPTRIGRTGYRICEETDESGTMYLNKASWDEVYENIGVTANGVRTGTTLFRHRPYIEVFIGWPDDPRRFYKGDFKEFTYLDVYTEWEECTLEWIMKHASAEQAIQYMKERGMTVCPMQ